jgi:5'-nucleotidase
MIKRKFGKSKLSRTRIIDDRNYRICIQGYHFNNSQAYLNISQEELNSFGDGKIVSTSAQSILEEYLRNNQNLDSNIEGRLVFKKKI